MFVGRPAGMVGFRTHTFTRIGSIMDKKQPDNDAPSWHSTRKGNPRKSNEDAPKRTPHHHSSAHGQI